MIRRILIALAVLALLPMPLVAQSPQPTAAEEEAPPPPSDAGMDMPPVIPGEMSDSRYNALKKLFEDADPEVQRGALCQFADSQRVRQDSHSLRLIKTFVRLVEEHTPKDGVMEEDTTYACALTALTTTILTHQTFKDAAAYRNMHFGNIGTPTFLREHLVPIYLPILKDGKHPLHTQSYYVVMAMGEEVAAKVTPTLVSQLDAIPHYTYDNQKDVESLVRALHLMGRESIPAVPQMVRLLLDESEVDYEGNFGFDGKRGLNAELCSAMVAIAGHEKQYQRVILKAINRSIEVDETYWSDKIRPQATPGTTDLTATMEQSRDKMLKIMGLESVQEMKDLF